MVWNSDHVSVSTDFPANSKGDAPSYCTAYDYSRADWDGLCVNLKDVLWKDIFKLGASAATSEFCECIQVEIDVYIDVCSLTNFHGFRLPVVLP